MGPPSDQGVAARSSTGRDGWTMTGQVPVVTQDLAWKAGDRESAGMVVLVAIRFCLKQVRRRAWLGEI